MLPFNPDLKIGSATYSDTEYLGLERLDYARARRGSELADYLNSAVTYAYGSSADFGRKNFPILMQTQGMNKKRAVDNIDNTVYSWMFGKPKKTSTIARTIHAPDARTGQGFQDFDIIFRDRHFQQGQIIHIGGYNGPQVQLMSKGTPEGSGAVRYTAKIFGNKGNVFVPFKYLQAGAVWSAGVIKVSQEQSRGKESRSYSPYRVQNMLSTIRESINVAGNIANKKMGMTINVDGKSYKFYYDWEKYLTELAWMEKKESDLLTSRFNKDAQGKIQNYDPDSGKPVISGMGIWDQIPSSNTMSYSRMTESKLENYITDILYITQSLDLVDTQNVVIDLMAGYGFLEEIDNALKRNTQLLTPIASSELYVTKTGAGSLQYGAYFTSYRHRSGVIIRFTHYPAFDYGLMAESADRHPLHPSRPLTSYNAMVMNFGFVSVDTKYNKSGQAGNIEYLYEEGREYIEGTVRGMAPIEGKVGGDIATDVDASALHMMCTQGVHCYYPMSLGKLECKIV